jgi:hypothetical protein
VLTDDLPPILLALLTAWQEQRHSPAETFQAFVSRHSEPELAALTERVAIEA